RGPCASIADFNFDFCDWHATARGTPGPDRADVDRQRRRRPFGKFERDAAANDVGDEQWHQLVAFFQLGEKLVPRRMSKERDVKSRFREAPLVLVVRMKCAARIFERRPFHGLQPASAAFRRRARTDSASIVSTSTVVSQPMQASVIDTP